jgi:hypothetical protein
MFNSVKGTHPKMDKHPEPQGFPLPQLLQTQPLISRILLLLIH